ncbi:MAG: hypothetical protein SAJ12_05530 [Jaaginema sp. PMC 1079.18]|nr:hypothetical protein [Jaaginema sp. PMC 1080.18]MEC4850452.1 hypothetical protein [Jaaginema sp. PMC 1079.18]MEC4867516.1 hypothetical protein [Jaaginema sp. PMC 1078.18]
MDYDVSSKQKRRGILAGMLLGVSRRDGNNFLIRHSDARQEYLLYKKALLEQITGKAVSMSEWTTPKGHRGWQIQPKQIPLIRVLVRQLYAGRDRVITRSFLNRLTPPGIAIWFLDCGSKSFKRRNQQICALDIYLNTRRSRADNEIIVAYFAEVWGIYWGLSRQGDCYCLRLGTTAGKAFLGFLQPYVPPCMLAKIQSSCNIKAAT